MRRVRVQGAKNLLVLRQIIVPIRGVADEVAAWGSQTRASQPRLGFPGLNNGTRNVISTR
jgi:hypothetical protein